VSLPSASRAQRAELCIGSVVLPGVDRENPYASRGSVIHAFLEALVRGTDHEEALAAVAAEHRPFAEAIPVDRLPVAGFAAEVALVYDPQADTGRELGRSIGRSYREHGWREHEEFAATVDVVGVDPNRGLVYVADWKTGFAEVPAPPDNLQLAIGAIAAARAYGCESAAVQLVMLREDGSAWRLPREPHVYDALDLDEIRDRLLRLRDRALRAQMDYRAGRLPDARAGGHCARCPAIASCPAAGGMVRRLVELVEGDGEPTVERVAAMLTPETAAAFLDRVRVVKRVLDVADEAVRAYAREHPIPLPDGRVWGPVPQTRETVDGAVVYHVVKGEAGEEAARQAVKWESSKTAIEGVARVLVAAKKQAGEKATIKGETKRMLDAVRDAGGVSETTYEVFKAHEPEALPAADDAA
jgi:hypothetical protein